MFSWLKTRQKKKQYRPTAWEEHLAPSTLAKIYDDQGWTGESGEWRRRNLARLAGHIERLSKEKTPVTVLDVACFNGDYLGRLMSLPNMERMLQYTGVDVTPSYVETAAKRWAQYTNAKFQVGSAFSLPFPDRSIDLVFNSGMLIHVDDPAKAIRECARVAAKAVLIETTVNTALKEDFFDEGKSGPEFIDRVYRRGFIRGIIDKVATVTEESEVPYYGQHLSVLWEARISGGG